MSYCHKCKTFFKAFDETHIVLDKYGTIELCDNCNRELEALEISLNLSYHKVISINKFKQFNKWLAEKSVLSGN